MLTVKKLRKDFQQGDQKVSVVRDVSFSVGEGQFASIIGSQVLARARCSASSVHSTVRRAEVLKSMAKTSR